jgi:hypothetical protein
MRGLIPIVVTLALAGCSASTSSPSTSRVRLRLTDAPGPGIASARVWISRASDPQEYDLLTLQDGVTALLGDATVPSGDYAQLRLVVDSARLTLEDGSSFADGSATRTLKVPSGSQTGIKVNFAGGLHITDDTDLLIDFSVTDNFVFQGPPTRPMAVLFTPHLKGSSSPAQPE